MYDAFVVESKSGVNVSNSTFFHEKIGCSDAREQHTQSNFREGDNDDVYFNAEAAVKQGKLMEVSGGCEA
jgi:hypothetical protein